jgi:hypothetical protein
MACWMIDSMVPPSLRSMTRSTAASISADESPEAIAVSALSETGGGAPGSDALDRRLDLGGREPGGDCCVGAFRNRRGGARLRFGRPLEDGGGRRGCGYSAGLGGGESGRRVGLRQSGLDVRGEHIKGGCFATGVRVPIKGRCFQGCVGGSRFGRRCRRVQIVEPDDFVVDLLLLDVEQFQALVRLRL